MRAGRVVGCVVKARVGLLIYPALCDCLMERLAQEEEGAFVECVGVVEDECPCGWVLSDTVFGFDTLFKGRRGGSLC